MRRIAVLSVLCAALAGASQAAASQTSDVAASRFGLVRTAITPQKAGAYAYEGIFTAPHSKRGHRALRTRYMEETLDQQGRVVELRLWKRTSEPAPTNAATEGTWDNGKCSVVKHCYAIAEINLAEAENWNTSVLWTEDARVGWPGFNVPNWQSGNFVDFEQWAVPGPAGYHWIEVGLEAGEYLDEHTTTPFWAYQTTAGEYVQRVYYNLEKSCQSNGYCYFDTQGEKEWPAVTKIKYVPGSGWCVYFEEYMQECVAGGFSSALVQVQTGMEVEENVNPGGNADELRSTLESTSRSPEGLWLWNTDSLYAESPNTCVTHEQITQPGFPEEHHPGWIIASVC